MVEIFLKKHEMGYMYNPLQIKHQRSCLSMSFYDLQVVFWEKHHLGPLGLLSLSCYFHSVSHRGIDMQTFLLADWEVGLKEKKNPVFGNLLGLAQGQGGLEAQREMLKSVIAK